MVMFKAVTEHQLMLLWCISMVANTSRFLPAKPASNCGTDVYQRVILTLDVHVLTALAAAVLLLAVRMAVGAAESNAVTALRLAVSAAEFNAVAATRAVHARAMALDARHQAVTVGVGCIAAKWRRASLRGMLLLAVVLSAASCLLAAVAFEEGCMYWIGCDAGYGVGSPLNVFLMVLMVLFHGSSAWVALSQN